MRKPTFRMPAKDLSDQVVTLERLDHALTMASYVLNNYGPAFIPIFERIEREIEIMRRREDASSRAARILVRHTINGGPKAIR